MDHAENMIIQSLHEENNDLELKLQNSVQTKLASDIQSDIEELKQEIKLLKQNGNIPNDAKQNNK